MPTGHAKPDKTPFFLAVFAVATFLSPFNAAIGFRPFGELGGDPFAAIQLFTAPFLIVSILKHHRWAVSRTIMICCVLFIVAIAISYLMNFDQINGASFRGRSGLEKMLNASLVAVAGFFLAGHTFIVARTNAEKFIIRPYLITSAIMVVVGFIELTAWYNGGVAAVYMVVSKIIHANISRGHYIPGRIHSVTFEPSFFGAYACVALPWMLREAVSRLNELRTRAVWAALAVGCLALCVLSGRTAQMGAPVALFMFFFLVQSFRGRGVWLDVTRVFCVLLVWLIMLGPAAYITFQTDEIAARIVDTRSSSNVSRFGTIAILTELFREHPLFGVGMGQYGFHVTSEIQSWAFNWEFKRWIEKPSASFFPSFSIVMRLAGELGLFGVGVFTFLVSSLTDQAFRQAQKFYGQHGRVPLFGVASITCLVGIPVYCWTAGGLKGFFLWGVIGIGAAYATSGPALEMARYRLTQPASGRPPGAAPSL